MKNEKNGGFNNDNWIQEHQKSWLEIGQELKSERETLGITKAGMSRKIGCAPSTLTKFEEGKPVQAAKIIENAYKMALELFQLEVS
ncbi:helix-turn-helix domain-containing protein [Bacillus norwichensis]|uniref:Helix-turn-helix transcriptional regulator n=1 Tax=Bacillus norwichensis TaxID=2762217 RepID=A0ABR8VIY9_9BACI|nr:helix-turn-helix transcriptional regulator [Bacillus norwichensis]MBD8004556.1 helix-turn-helix transcriptional regulator [Bacillus norwichensis]